MLRTQRTAILARRRVLSPASRILLLLLATFTLSLAGLPTRALAQCQVKTDGETYPMPPLTYPMTSNRFAVQYKAGGGGWTDAQVYITYYGGSNSSPFFKFSGYSLENSMSFVSIPADVKTKVRLRVTKLFGTPFNSADQVSIRPSVKGISAGILGNRTVQITRKTSADFAGEQFVLWWNRTTESAATDGLVFFLNPPYERPTGSNVKMITTAGDLTGDLSGIDSLDFEGTVAIGTTGAQTFVVPANISSIFLGPGAWVQGKLRFKQTGLGKPRHLFGPGVLDVSRFEYDLRFCDGDQGYKAISWDRAPAAPDKFLIDGIVISDPNYYATDLLVDSTVNNSKIIGWNGNNDGFEFGLNAKASNIFVRTGDDSLKIWGASITVTNATVWQNYNGGVINLGWSDNSPGDSGLIDGVYVVKTDWQTPTDPNFTVTTVSHQNNGVIASMMLPGTRFGSMQPSTYRNIYVEDAPQVLFSLKILPIDCGRLGLQGNCPQHDLTLPSVLNLNVENLFTPPSAVTNSIGFQTLPPGFSQSGQSFPHGYTLTGSMSIGLTNVNIKSADGTMVPLTSANAASVGKLSTNGDLLNIQYGSSFLGSGGPQWYSAWTAPQGDNIAPTSSLNGTSVRMIARPTISGSAVRVKIENTVGQSPVTFAAAYIGESQSGAAIKAGSNTQLTFHGSPTVTLGPGEGAYSDPVTFPVTAFTRYAISLDVTAASDISAHALGLVTNYIAAGAHAADPSGSGFAPIPNGVVDAIRGPTFPVYWVASVDVLSKSNTGTVVTLGDSITDGTCSTRTNSGAASGMVVPDLYNRWADLLATRFAGLQAGQSKAVANQGIAGNRIASGLQPAVVRLANDVLSREGVTHVIFLEGTNDIAFGTTAADLMAADRQIIDDAHKIGLGIIGATIIPRGGDPAWTSTMEQERLAMNDWIRHTANFDGIIDFDALLQGPANATSGAVSIPSQYSCFDGTHPNSAGHAAMASFIDLSLFGAKHSFSAAGPPRAYVGARTSKSQ